MFKVICLLSFMFFTSFVNAAELKGVTMADSITLDGKKLLLNGQGIRVAKKFGLNFNVYIGGLYVSKKSTVAKELMANTDPKRIIMHFILGTRVSKQQLIDGWEKVLRRVCEYDCENMKPHEKAFYKLMDDMKKGQQIVLDFKADGLHVKSTGRYKKQGVIPSPAFAKNILLAFISDKIERNKLNTGLLHGKPK